jgi:hypothetical protein
MRRGLFFAALFALGRVAGSEVEHAGESWFVAPRHGAGAGLAALRREGRGRCWMLAAAGCRKWRQYNGRYVDEGEAAYLEQGVGEKEEACLLRAETNWRLCNSMKTQPVIMTFLPTGATASYPPDDVVIDAHERIKNSFAIVYTAIFGSLDDGSSYDPLPHVVKQTVDTEFWVFSDRDMESLRPSPHSLNSHQTEHDHHT